MDFGWRSCARPLATLALCLALSGLPDSLLPPLAAQDGGVPARPTGLSAVPTHSVVTLRWDDPSDASITHYEILRRDRAIHEVGEFVTINPDTGSPETTYADATVKPEQSYVYRVRAVNAHGVSESSGFSRADTLAAPAVELTPEPNAQGFDGVTTKSADRDQGQVRSVPADATCPGGGYNPAPTPVQVSAVPIVVASTTAQYFVLYVKHDVGGAEVELPVLVKRGEAGTTTLAENVAALPAERYRVQQYLIADPADVDGDCIDDISELADPARFNPLNSAVELPLPDGAVGIPDGAAFEAIASDGVYVKFILFGLDIGQPGIYFMNTETHEHHGRFLDAIGVERTNEMVTGVLQYEPDIDAADGSRGVYTFWLSKGDEPFSTVTRVYALLAASMPLVADNFVFRVRQRALPLVRTELSLYAEGRIRLLLDSDVSLAVRFLPLNTGEGYGRLRLMQPSEQPHPRDIVIYEALPNELPRVAGIISTEPQTPLSHVNLRAVQNGIPNAFIRDALEDDDIDDLLGSYVHYDVGEREWDIRAATRAEVEAHYVASRPAVTQTPQRDLSITTIRPLSGIGFDDWRAFGVKAANVAVLRTLGLPRQDRARRIRDPVLLLRDLHDRDCPWARDRAGEGERPRRGQADAGGRHEADRCRQGDAGPPEVPGGLRDPRRDAG